MVWEVEPWAQKGGPGSWTHWPSYLRSVVRSTFHGSHDDSTNANLTMSQLGILHCHTHSTCLSTPTSLSAGSSPRPLSDMQGPLPAFQPHYQPSNLSSLQFTLIHKHQTESVHVFAQAFPCSVPVPFLTGHAPCQSHVILYHLAQTSSP